MNRLFAAVIAAVALLPIALAHVTVRTEIGQAESKAGATETYRLNVPNEKPVPTTGVRLVVPAGLTITRFMQQPGWERSVVRDASGRITEVSWKGSLPDGEFTRFIFQARNPAEAGTLVWKAYQAYADGSVVAWDDSSPDSPASKTEIRP